MRVLIGSLAVAIAAAVPVLGCGGGGSQADSSSGSGALSSPAQFAPRAESICQRGNNHIGIVSEETLSKVNNPSGAVLIKLTRDVAAPGVLEELRELRALEVSDPVKRRIAPVLGREQAAALQLRRNPASAKALSRGDPIAGDPATRRLGLSLCGFGDL